MVEGVGGGGRIMEGTGLVCLRHSRPPRMSLTLVGVGVYNLRAVLYSMRLRVEASRAMKASRRRVYSASAEAIEILRIDGSS